MVGSVPSHHHSSSFLDGSKWCSQHCVLKDHYLLLQLDLLIIIIAPVGVPDRLTHFIAFILIVLLVITFSSFLIDL